MVAQNDTTSTPTTSTPTIVDDVLQRVNTFFTSHTEELEQRLTLLSIQNDTFEVSNTTVMDIKTEYINQLYASITCDNTVDGEYYIDMYADRWFEDAFTTVNHIHQRRTNLQENMNQLKELKLPEQRSKEWYEIREHLLTASSLADALGKGHFQTRDGLLISKTSEAKPFITDTNRDIMQWGVKYEPVATEFYEYLHDLKIVEFGLIPHPKLSVFGASPDGICDIGSPNGYEGRMLEIKCPPRRKFTHDVPLHYWMQMQGQLEVCDLDECDFLQVKLEEYADIHEYENDVYDTTDNHGTDNHGKTKQGFPKGLLIAYKKKGTMDIEYKYSSWLAPLADIVEWRDTVLHELTDEYEIYEMKWWRIERYECTLVRRDKAWWLSVVPDIITFWKDVVHYRKVGNEDVQKRIDSRKRGPRKKVFEIKEPIKGYLMDSDED
jgi:putative phage-type endonuclease